MSLCLHFAASVAAAAGVVVGKVARQKHESTRKLIYKPQSAKHELVFFLSSRGNLLALAHVTLTPSYLPFTSAPYLALPIYLSVYPWPIVFAAGRLE